MSSDFRLVTLAEVTTKIGSGQTPRGGKDAYKGGDYALIRSQNIYNDGFSTGGLAYIDDEQASQLSNVEVWPGDVLLNITGNVARCCRAPDWVLPARVNQHVSILRVDPQALDSGFLRYFLVMPESQHKLLTLASGGATRNALTKGMLELFEISLPPLKEQKAIAQILGTLDDKIEVNRKTNETLEAMAKALFKSWFVDFDPVRAKAEGRSTGLADEISDLFPDSFEESELGEIPRGWSTCSVNDLCEWVSSGGTPSRSRSDFWENGAIPWFKTGELNDAPLLDSVEKINELALGNSSCKLWEAGTILFAIYASPTVGRLGVLTESGTSNQAAAGLKAKPTFGTPFLRRTLLFSRDELQNIAVGAAQQNINVQILKDHKVVDPGATLASHYSNTIVSMDEQQICLAKNTRELCSLRDALLPRLISGELRIPEAEQLLEEAGV